MERDDKLIHKLYRDSMRREMARPEVRAAKKAFIRNYFEEVKPFYHRPAVMVPSLALLGVLILIFVFPRPLGERTMRVTEGPPALTTDAYLEVLDRTVDTGVPSVQVKRITSHVGPTMVYQKLYHDVPITIVWVFPGEVL